VTRRVHPVRRLLVIVLAALLAAPILVPRGSVPAVLAQERSSAELERELDEQQRERDRVADELGSVRSELTSAEEELAQISARLEDARDRLVAAEGQVELAEAALAEAEERRDEAVAAHERSKTLLAEAEEDLRAQEELLAGQLVHTFKYGSSGAQAGAIALEMLRRAEDPNEFSVGMKQLETIVDVQDATVQQVFALREVRQDRAEEAASTRRDALQAEAEAAETLGVVEELREEAATLAAEVAADEEAQQVLIDGLQSAEADAAVLLASVESRTNELRDDLARARAAEEAARREEERRRAREAAAAGGGGASSGGGRLATPGAGGGPDITGIVCPVQGAVAGRDFSNDWGYPRSGGRYHQGNDIFARRGTAVVAAQNATIVRWNPPSAQTSLGGITVTYRTADGSEWYNAHLDSVASGIAPGVSVAAGQTIGTVGTTGNARGTPPHLHLGRKSGGSWVNPWPTISPVC
jgi:murein DD-endopeptidase MepM/ murein hydrolase activator NlpD